MDNRIMGFTIHVRFLTLDSADVEAGDIDKLKGSLEEMERFGGVGLQQLAVRGWEMGCVSCLLRM